jgi:hypothetical protein
MVPLERLAEAALAGNALLLRGLAQDWLRENPRVTDCAPPQTDNPELLSVAAALVELFCSRLGQPPPPWSSDVGPLASPVFLLRAAATMKRLRLLCEQESPEPLRRRNLFAPAEFLQFA